MPPCRILFVCHGNIFRSAFAHRRLLSLMDEARRARIQVRSAGTRARAGEPPPDVVLEGALAYGLDLSDHASTLLTADLADWATRIFAMQSGMIEEIEGMSAPAAVRTRLLGSLDPEAPDPEIPDVGGDGSVRESVSRRFARIDGLLRILLERELDPSRP
jgi:protein-tyrosine-phosphatase